MIYTYLVRRQCGEDVHIEAPVPGCVGVHVHSTFRLTSQQLMSQGRMVWPKRRFRHSDEIKILDRASPDLMVIRTINPGHQYSILDIPNYLKWQGDRQGLCRRSLRTCEYVWAFDTWEFDSRILTFCGSRTCEQGELPSSAGGT